MSSIVYNMDCMEGMKQYPDKYFDLAIVDPPYGAGFTEGGGCTGWFTKYREDQQKRGGNNLIGIASERGSTDTNNRQSRGGNPKDKFPWQEEVQTSTDRDRTRRRTANGSSRIGTKTKKSFRGMWRLNRNTLKNCFASHVIR